MLSILMARLRQGHRTASYPRLPPVLPERFRGRPVLDPDACAAGCRECDGVCPTGALVAGRGRLTLDLGRCLFCGECARRCTRGAIRFTRDHQLAARRREDLTLDGKEVRLAAALDEKSRRLFGRSLKLRQVSAGGCNACESDCNVLNTLVFDLGRFGIQFVASPRHADGLVVTGPVSRNMEMALKKTYDAVPSPKIVVAVGACSISGGIYGGHPEQCDGVAGIVPVDVFIPGCPPHPYTILDGLLQALGRVSAARDS